MINEKNNDEENIIPLADKKTLEELSKSILKCIKKMMIHPSILKVWQLMIK